MNRLLCNESSMPVFVVCVQGVYVSGVHSGVRGVASGMRSVRSHPPSMSIPPQRPSARRNHGSCPPHHCSTSDPSALGHVGNIGRKERQDCLLLPAGSEKDTARSFWEVAERDVFARVSVRGMIGKAYEYRKRRVMYRCQAFGFHWYAVEESNSSEGSARVAAGRGGARGPLGIARLFLLCPRPTICCLTLNLLCYSWLAERIVRRC
ncbi:hypothetical protein HDK77DRAFT_432676 [Phyllosticta capitalensis]